MGTIGIALEKKRIHMLYVFLIGFFLAFVIFLPFLIFDKGLFIYYGDFDVQQIPFYRLSHEAVRTGALGFNWTTDLGVNFIGSYSFYTLGSPFFWLTIPFPLKAVPYLMAPLLMLKFALTSVTGYAFINRFTKTSKIAMLGGLMYAFSGFNIYNIFFNHFNEVVMIFPLLLIALEESVINKRRGVFALAVALCAVVNYYFFFGEVIFVIIYFFVRLRNDDFKVDLKMFAHLFFEAVIGLFMSAILLLPSIFALMGNTRTSDTIEGYNTLIYGNAQRYGLILSSFFFPPDIPARPNFFPDSNAKWSSVSMFLPLFSMTGVIAFIKSKTSIKHFAKTLIIISVIICFVPFLNAAFSAFNYAYYARWFYMPLLIMALATAHSIEDCIEQFPFALKVTGGFVAMFSLIGIMPKKVDGKLVWFSLTQHPDWFWVYVLVALFGILCTWLLVLMTPKHKKFMQTAICCFCAITFTFSGFMIFIGKQQGNGYDIVVNQGLHGAQKLDLEGDYFYRIDTFDEMDNLGMFWGIPTINAFHSVVPASITDYYTLIGGERVVASRPEERLVGVRALANVKYVFSKEDKKDYTPQLGFSYYDTQNGYKIYKNDYFVPMGIAFNYRISQELMDNTSSHKDRLLLKGIYFDEEKYPEYLNTLPILTKDDKLELSNDEKYLESCEALSLNAVKNFSYSSYGFSADYISDEESFVFFSVPYDRGFSAEVNGEEVPIIKANGGFMAVNVQEGNNHIEFSYKTPGLAAGSIISALSLLILIIYSILCYIYKKKHPAQFIKMDEVPCSVDMLYIEENNPNK